MHTVLIHEMENQEDGEVGNSFLCTFRFCISIASAFYVMIVNIEDKNECVKLEKRPGLS